MWRTERQWSWLVLMVVGSSLFLAAQPQRRLEVQLAGIRLGSPVIDKDEAGNLKPYCLLRVWGLPDFIITPSGGAAQPGTLGMPGAPMMPGRSDDARRTGGNGKCLWRATRDVSLPTERR